jgi:hypothetical protein
MTFWRREEFLFPVRILTPIRPARGLATIEQKQKLTYLYPAMFEDGNALLV